MIKIKDIKTDQDPETDIVRPSPSGDALEDGNLITKVLLSNRGLNTNRFKKLTYEQMLYCEDILCAVVQNLCDHLNKLSYIRINSQVYMTHLEDIKK